MRGATATHNRRSAPGSMSIERAVSAGESLNLFAYLRLKEFKDVIRVKRHTLVLDITMDPMAFVWPVKGQSITLCATEETIEHARRWARALIADGADLVALCTTTGRAAFYRQPPPETHDETA